MGLAGNLTKTGFGFYIKGRIRGGRAGMTNRGGASHMILIIMGILAFIIGIFANFTLSVTMFFIIYYIVDFIVSCRKIGEEAGGTEGPGR